MIFVIRSKTGLAGEYVGRFPVNSCNENRSISTNIPLLFVRPIHYVYVDI